MADKRNIYTTLYSLALQKHVLIARSLAGRVSPLETTLLHTRPSWLPKRKAYSTRYSQAVTHPSTNLALPGLTAVIGREPVFSRWYGRRQFSKARLFGLYSGPFMLFEGKCCFFSVAFSYCLLVRCTFALLVCSCVFNVRVLFW